MHKKSFPRKITWILAKLEVIRVELFELFTCIFGLVKKYPTNQLQNKYNYTFEAGKTWKIMLKFGKDHDTLENMRLQCKQLEVGITKLNFRQPQVAARKA